MNKNLWIISVALFFLAGAGFLMVRKFTDQLQIACTEEAKICPNGSAVGRIGPKCEFAPCPSPQLDLWETKMDSEQKISFQYPKELTTRYIHAQEWPPKIRIDEGFFSCAGERRIVSTKEYCMQKENEGAAGSTYTTYHYSTLGTEGKIINAIFTFRYPQCGNYEEVQMKECEAERAAFDLDLLVHKIVTSIQPL